MAPAAKSLAPALAAALMWCAAPQANAAGPSFPCTGRLNLTERTICSDPDLASLDRAVAAAYRSRYDALPVETANALEEIVRSLVITQKAWLAHRNRCGADRGCIRRAYVIRKESLTTALKGADVPCSKVVGAAQAAIYVRDCKAVASETHPPCNAVNSCELIISHNIVRCFGLGDGAPRLCAAYLLPQK